MVLCVTRGCSAVQKMQRGDGAEGDFFKRGVRIFRNERFGNMGLSE